MLEQIFEKYNLDFTKIDKNVYKNNNTSTVILKDHEERNKILNGYVIIVNDDNDVILYIFDKGINGNTDKYYQDLLNEGYNNIYTTLCEYCDKSDDFIGTMFLKEELGD